MVNELKNELLEVYQGLADVISNVPREYRCEQLKGEIEELKVLILKYSERKVLDFTLSIAGSDTIELQWLARAGVSIAHSHLLDALSGDDGDNVLRAAIGLVYLGESKGIEVINEFANRTHRLSDEVEPKDELYDALLECDLPVLIRIKEGLG
ncbi:MAG: hypothetical protein OQK51_13785 [Kangiellaceae bacterium]|nr:hypothetical protein [Kangiellaceae bacterium]